jgi:hypothetical protein
MPDTEKYARTTISVPPALKEQMETVETSVNWSALACRAFEDKLAEIAAHKEKKDMNDIVTRLRASKRQAEDAQYKAGAEAGREWAGDTAEADELQRLERWSAETRQHWGWDKLFTEGNGSDSPVAELVVSTVWPDADGNYGYSSVQDLWEQALGDNTSAKDDPSFVKGFVEGALALWDEVKDQL